MATAKEKRDAREAEQKAMAAAEATAAGKLTSEQITELNKERTIHPDRTPNALGDVVQPAGSSEKVIVGVKIGVPYIDIQLSRLEEKDEQTQTGIRRVREAVRFGDVVRLRGTAYPRGTVPEGFPDRPEIVHGATMNRGIDKDFIMEWMRQTAPNPLVSNRMIFVAKDEVEFRAIAAEIAGERSGFEPLDPRGKDPRMPTPTNKDVGKLEPGKEVKAAAT